MQATNLERARLALEGLSVGDALGGFLEGSVRPLFNSTIVKNRKPPDIEWRYTDDTNMALSVYAILRRHGEIQQDELAAHFAEHYDRLRGYGAGARRLIRRLGEGINWREVSPNLFDGGSYGNGSAMRVAPLGAYFADDLDLLATQARLSSEITHYHPEGIAGAIAAALASAFAWCLRGQTAPSRADFIGLILPYLPESEVKARCQQAQSLQSTEIDQVVRILGNGAAVSAQDTLPICLFMAGEYLNNYEEAIWQTLSAGGDADTNAAIVGGIVALYTGYEGIPQDWLSHREKLPQWAFED